MVKIEDCKVGRIAVIHALIRTTDSDRETKIDLVNVELPDGDDYTFVPNDINAVIDPPLEPLKVGDRVRNESGLEWEVVAPPRQPEDGPEMVALWNDTEGYAPEYAYVLTRIPDAP